MPDRKHKPQAEDGAHAPKVCVACGRTMTWRKAWAKNWNDIKFCSDMCRKQQRNDAAREQDRALEAAILQLLRERGVGKTICPSEAARAVANDDAREIWEPLMEAARAAARRLVAEGSIVITQAGHTVDPSSAKGPIRLRLLR